MASWMKRLLPVALVLVAGCAMDPSVKPWWTLSEANFLALKASTATKADVRAALGKPIAEMRFAALGEDVWDYRFLNGTMIMVAAVHFNSRSGAYMYYVSEPDPAFYSTIGP